MCKCCDADIKNESEKQLILYYSFDQYTINTNNEMIKINEILYGWIFIDVIQ